MSSEKRLQEIKGAPVLEGTGTRVLREVLRTPAFVEIIKLNITCFDRQQAKALVRTLLFEDSSLSLGVLSQSPEAVNYMAEVLIEIIAQLEKFPPELLDKFITQIIDDLESDTFERLSGTARSSLSRIFSENPKLRQKAADGLIDAANSVIRNAAELLGKADQIKGQYSPSPEKKLDVSSLAEVVSLSAGLINRTMDDNPEFINEIQKKTDYVQVSRVLIRLGYAITKGMLQGGLEWIASVFRFKRKR